MEIAIPRNQMVLESEELPVLRGLFSSEVDEATTSSGTNEIVHTLGNIYRPFIIQSSNRTQSSRDQRQLDQRYSDQGHSRYSDQGHSRYSDQGHSRYSDQGHSRYSDQGHSSHSDQEHSSHSDQRHSSHSDRRHSSRRQFRSRQFQAERNTPEPMNLPPDVEMFKYNILRKFLDKFVKHGSKLNIKLDKETLQYTCKLFNDIILHHI
ncbi:hypothetical protein TNIN_468961 [Trichonephila inaurata madagascariensis]|uniref:Uncharacterized protein n=1 Tax=Trichonephila inaurata madagascariensis TaxID=2747483 RepID=A0A8X6YCH2_9ARAC|nr:hypothetical protein TNIN_468961 [Trichonephila inaurata madagascariensis]